MGHMKKGTGIVTLILIIIGIGLMGAYSASVLLKDGINGWGEDRKLKLGLDLAGGVSITYEVEGDTPTQEQLSDTIFKLQQRIENDLSAKSTTTEASVYPVGDRRISVEIPGVTDANALLEELGTPGQLYFIAHKDSEGNETYSTDPQTGEYKLNYDIDTLVDNGSVIATGSNVVSAKAGYNTNQTTQAQEAVVQLQFDEEATKSFADATAKAVANNNDSIGIYYDERFISVPSVNSEISGGECIIEGMGDYEAAESLASYIRIGGLDLKLKELQSEVVGAQLGSNALNTSLAAGGIGLILVILFLIIIYLVPGFAASISLLLYTTLMITLIHAFDVTLTLPGVAGIVLTIGMAVDANVIIFARIREEIDSGKSLWAAVDIGFKKALAAILDGNITTLIAAIVLILLGSGTVKGFAITLAMGVIVSMFTALFITKIILSSFIALGINKSSSYARKTPKMDFDFVGKRNIFFAISLAIIIAGLGVMGYGAATGKKALNYSQEFLGGTSTTIGLKEDLSLAKLDDELVPVVSDITNDNDIQVQKIQGSNSVIIKTRNLELSEREALNKSLMEKFKLEESSISSESIGSTISSEMRSQSLIAISVAVLCMLIYIWIRFKDIRFGTSAIICLIHDVLIVLTLYAVARLSVGSAFIACILTVIGYSVNATIVTYDRVRENLSAGVKDKEALMNIANKSINQTVTRNISTTITTAFTVLMLLILGVSSIREFALPLLAGVLAGAWSSIFIATSLWYIMRAYIGKGTNISSKPKDKPKTNKATKENQGILV